MLPELKAYGIQPWFNITLGSSNWDEIDDFIKFGLEESTIINFVTPRPHTIEQKFLIVDLISVLISERELTELDQLKCL